MFRLIYISTSLMVSEDGLDSVLEKSISNNQRDEITGCLLLSDGVFVQYLEGNEEQVRNTFNRIKKDPRHENTALLLADRIDERLFPYWSMTYQDPNSFDRLELERIRNLFKDVGAERTGLQILSFLREVRSKMPNAMR